MPDRQFILAVETSSRIGSVALGTEHKLVDERTFSAPLRHSTELFPAVQDLLHAVHAGPEDIDQIYVSIGPGSFTGLRIAVSLAKAMYLATGVKIVTVDTLDVIAANVLQSPLACPACIATVLDAKRNQFFMAGYRLNPSASPAEPNSMGVWTKLMDDCIITAQEFMTDFVTSHTPVGLLGDGLLFHQAKFTHPGISILHESLWTPKAAGVYRLGRRKARQGQFTAPLELAPRYLRAPLVTLKQRQ
jgi:tRNA threonylcarbamoyl adenosine modification protein YeaZ